MQPEISVVVASHDRPVRLRWLLNALAEQDLERDRWEVVVGHDSSGPETEELLRDHPLAAAGVLRWAANPPGTCPPGANRNAAWRIARAPLIAFTDDDCRPPSDWLRKTLAAAGRHPGAIVQGTTLPDPDEAPISAGSWVHSQLIRPPHPWAQCSNVVYPREVLEAVGGFDPALFVGEDYDLASRAGKAGAQLVAEPGVVTYHAVVEMNLVQRVRSAWRFRDLPRLVKNHPELRDDYPLWFFWKRTHVWLPFAVVGFLLGKRNRAAMLLALPWLIHTFPPEGADPRGRVRKLLTIPARAAVDGAEFAALAAGSVKERSLLL